MIPPTWEYTSPKLAMQEQSLYKISLSPLTHIQALFVVDIYIASKINLW